MVGVAVYALDTCQGPCGSCQAHHRRGALTESRKRRSTCISRGIFSERRSVLLERFGRYPCSESSAGAEEERKFLEVGGDLFGMNVIDKLTG